MRNTYRLKLWDWRNESLLALPCLWIHFSQEDDDRISPFHSLPLFPLPFCFWCLWSLSQKAPKKKKKISLLFCLCFFIYPSDFWCQSFSEKTLYEWLSLHYLSWSVVIFTQTFRLFVSKFVVFVLALSIEW